MKKETIFLASDHAGFKVKQNIKKFLDRKKISYHDLGPKEYIANDDYPDYAFKVASRVARNKNYKGILVCGSGIGMVIAANKVKGIRAVAAYDKYSAKFSKSHNDSNVLCLRAKNFPFRRTKKILSTWLNTRFSEEDRHNHRIKKIWDYEK
ncbi:MAG: ribose 5-phosphate isomerase B [Nanoarchaeota archaeon]|nr:ribose 5-phosphate isomerase B [Nanoarchaeota archaeon]MBU1051738.1 ribose 5-phosphate isomerase B [Nanoarchaeota archaeon]